MSVQTDIKSGLYLCTCGYYGPGWDRIGIQKVFSERQRLAWDAGDYAKVEPEDRWVMANCPKCHSSCCVEQVYE